MTVRRAVCRCLLLALVVGLCACASKPGTQGGTARDLATLSDQTPVQKRAQIRLQLAIGYFQQHQLTVALDEVKLALQADPNFSDAYGVRALIYMDMGETRLADDNFLKAIELAPNNPDLSNNYGWFLCQNGRAAQAMPYFETAIASRNYQSPAKALNNAGVCSLKLGREPAAEGYFLQAFRSDPQDSAASISLAKLYFVRGDYQHAQFYLSRATKMEAADAVPVDLLWLAVKIEHKLGNRAAEAALGAQMRRLYAGSPAYAAYQRGAFDE